MMSKTKNIALLGVGTALYIVFSASVKIPLISHISTDLGYAVFGAFLAHLGWIATPIGVLGCMISSLLFSGWIPVGWMLGQAFIGMMTGYAMKSKIPRIAKLLCAVISVFIGVAIIKTITECMLYGIPIEIKFAKNFVAFVADTIPFLTGIVIEERIKDYEQHR